MVRTMRLAMFVDKGGTGKTTMTAHLGVALAGEGLDVLLIDLAGKQGDLAKQFGVWGDYQGEIETDEAWPNITTTFQEEWDMIAERLGEPEAVEDLIMQTEESVDLIPAHPGLDTLDAELGNIDDARERYSRLKSFLDEYVDPYYDAVLLDLPGLTNNVSYNGLWAARNVVAPVEMGPFEADQAERLRDDLQQMSETFDVGVELTMVLPNKMDSRARLAEEYLHEYRQAYPDAIAPKPVPKSQDIRNAAEDGRTIFTLERRSKTAEQAREAIETNARTLMERIIYG